MADIKTLILKVLSQGAKQAEKELNGVSLAALTAENSAGGLSASMEKLGSVFMGVGGAMTLGITLPLLGLGTAAVKTAADAEALGIQFRATFGEDIDAANEAIDRLNQKFGNSKVQLQAMTGATGAMLKSMGATSAEALQLTEGMTDLSLTLAAYKGVSDEVANSAIQMALMGQTRGLKQLGISLEEADIQQRLLLKGQQDLTGEARKLAEAQATLELIYEKSTDAISNFDETQTTLNDKMGDFRASLQDLGATFGEILLPIIKEIVDKLQGWVNRLQKLNPEQQKFILILAGIAAGVGPVLLGVGQLLTLFVKLQPVVAMLAGPTGIPAMVAALTGPVGLVVAAGIAAAALAGLYIYWSQSQTRETAQGFEDASMSMREFGRQTELTGEEVARLREQSEIFFTRRAAETESLAQFEGQVREFAARNNLEFEKAVILLQTSTALSKQQAGYAKQLATQYGLAAGGLANQSAMMDYVTYQQKAATKEQEKQNGYLAGYIELQTRSAQLAELTPDEKRTEAIGKANAELLAAFLQIDKMAAAYEAIGVEYDALSEKQTAFNKGIQQLSSSMYVSTQDVLEFTDAYKDLFEIGAQGAPPLPISIDSSGLGLFDKLIAKIKEMAVAGYTAADAIASIGVGLLNAVPAVALDGIKELGKAFSDGSISGQELGAVMANMAKQILDMLPMLFLQAGLTAIVSGQYALGLGLIAAAGVSAFASGFVEGAAESDSADRSMSTASSTDTARSISYATGGSISAAPVTVNVENYSGAPVSATSERGPNGEQILKMAVGSAYKSMTSDGEFNDVNRSVYGLQPVGVRQ